MIDDEQRTYIQSFCSYTPPHERVTMYFAANVEAITKVSWSNNAM